MKFILLILMIVGCNKTVLRDISKPTQEAEATGPVTTVKQEQPEQPEKPADDQDDEEGLPNDRIYKVEIKRPCRNLIIIIDKVEAYVIDYPSVKRILPGTFRSRRCYFKVTEEFEVFEIPRDRRDYEI